MENFIENGSSVLDTMNLVASGDFSLEEGLEALISYFNRQLDIVGVVKNTQNSGLIASLILAKILPNELSLSSLQNCGLEIFSEAAPEVFSIQRGIAVLVYRLASSNLGIAKASKALDEFIEEQGYLPDPDDVFE